MANKNDTLNFSYSILKDDWDKFEKRASKHPNIGFGKGEKDDNGDYDYAFLKKEKVFLAKYYTEDMEISTDVTKSNFFKFIRGANIDIYSTVMESMLENSKYVLMQKNHAGIPHPSKVVEGLKNAEKQSYDFNESLGKQVMSVVLYESLKSDLIENPSGHNMGMMESLEFLNSKFENNNNNN